MGRFISLVSTFALLYVPIEIKAQWSAAPQVIISIPSSDFANVSGIGGGFGIKVIRDFGKRGGLGLRGDFSFLSHGREFTQVLIRGVPFFAEIKHQSFRLTFGPQYSFGSRKFKMYGGALGGFYIFRSNTNINTGFQFFQQSTGNAALGWNVGGGLQYDVGLGPFLDVSFEYQTVYNVPSTVFRTLPSGEIQSMETDITANEYTIKIGIIFFLK